MLVVVVQAGRQAVVTFALIKQNHQMTHNEKRTHWVKEGAIGLSTGILFGLTNVVVGHVSWNIQSNITI